MNFNLYLDADSAKRLERLAKKTGLPRNALIRQAVRALLDQPRRIWPAAVLDFEGEPGLLPFESHRNKLAATRDDPFAVLERPVARRKVRRARP